MTGAGGSNSDVCGTPSWRPLHAWSSDERSAVAEVFSKVLSDWRRDWGIAHAAAHHGNAHAARAGQKPVIDGILQSIPWGFSAGPRAAALGACADRAKPSAQALARRAIGLSIFADASPEPSHRNSGESIADEVAQQAWDDWIARLTALPCFAAGAPGEATTPAQFANPRQWDGLLRVDLAWCGGAWSLWLRPCQTRKLLAGDAREKPGRKNQNDLVDLTVAIQGIALSLDVSLAPANLSLGRILDLRAGDIVALKHPLADPVYLASSDGQHPLARAWLGRSRAHKAVELDSALAQGAAK